MCLVVPSPQHVISIMVDIGAFVCHNAWGIGHGHGVVEGFALGGYFNKNRILAIWQLFVVVFPIFLLFFGFAPHSAVYPHSTVHRKLNSTLVTIYGVPKVGECSSGCWLYPQIQYFVPTHYCVPQAKQDS